MFISFFHHTNKKIKSEKLTIYEILEQVPLSERRNIEYFFKNFVVENCFGYVLLGNKPMSLSLYYNLSFTPSKKNSFLYFFPKNYKVKKGFDLWEKNKCFFPMKNYLIKKEPNPWNPKNELILFIDKKRFVQTIEDNIDVFQTILERKIIPTELLAEAENSFLLRDILQENDFLIGILLGYGRNNSKIFYLTTKQNYRNNNFKYVWYDNDLNKNIMLKMKLIDGLSGKIFQNLENMRLPDFLAEVSSDETLALKKTYLIDRQNILEFYSRGDFLENTLKKLTED